MLNTLSMRFLVILNRTFLFFFWFNQSITMHKEVKKNNIIRRPDLNDLERDTRPKNTLRATWKIIKVRYISITLKENKGEKKTK